MKGSEKNNEMILISLTVPGWPSLLCCHQMASALLLLPDQPGPGLQERKSTVWHDEALDATTAMSQAAFSTVSLSLFLFSLLLFSGCNRVFRWLRSLKAPLRGHLCVLADCV